MIKLNYDPRVVTIISQGIQIELGDKIHNILILGERNPLQSNSINKNSNILDSYQQISGYNLAYSIFNMSDLDKSIESLQELIEEHKKDNIIKTILCYVNITDTKKVLESEIPKLEEFISIIKELIKISREPNSYIKLFVMDKYNSLSKLRYEFDYYVDIKN